MLAACSGSAAVGPPDANPLQVVIDRDLDPIGAWRVGRQPAEDGRNEWIDVESLHEGGSHHIVITISSDPYRHVTEFWMTRVDTPEFSVVARARSIEVPSGITWPMRDPEGTARINPASSTDEAAGEAMLVLEYEVTGDHSGSPVTWRGKVAVPSLE